MHNRRLQLQNKFNLWKMILLESLSDQPWTALKMQKHSKPHNIEFLINTHNENYYSPANVDLVWEDEENLFSFENKQQKS